VELADFRTNYPEFNSASDSLVTAKLADAALRVNSDAFGTSYDMAHGLMTAHLLWSSPFGASMRRDGGNDDEDSRYRLEFGRLRLEVVPRVVVL